MIIIQIRTAEDLQREAEWLSRQPRWVQRAYCAFYGSMFIVTVGVIIWGAWITFRA